MKRILILGIDGYIGYSLALHLLKQGYEVCGVDNFSRREKVARIGGDSLTKISEPNERINYLKSFPNYFDQIATINLTQFYHLKEILDFYKPTTIVHLAEQPSAPYSMIGPEEAIETQQDNIIGTLSLLWAMRYSCPETHLIKLGTMGEYGTPKCTIPEGIIPNNPCAWSGTDEFGSVLTKKCPMSGLLFPRQPGSFYHLSKVHDTYNIDFACRTWGLTCTDIMQGVVYGLNDYKSPEEITRFDYDEHFGTVINRFCAQALIEQPLTIYGAGEQTRGYLPLSDSLACLQIAIDNPPPSGNYRTFNQFGQIMKINTIAMVVMNAASSLHLDVSAEKIPNPRKEDEVHTYNTTNESLIKLGYKPNTKISNNIKTLLFKLKEFTDRIKKEVILPKTTWR